MGKGWTKVAYQSTHKGKDVVVKMISHETENVQACLERGKYFKEEECFLYANYKLMKEIMLSLQLDNWNNIYKKHSTTATLLDDKNYILNNMDGGYVTGASFLDLKKAFDTRLTIYFYEAHGFVLLLV